jgi:ElaB/YqjD/DUF883 family membrane-anchored ribosome-binding protein
MSNSKSDIDELKTMQREAAELKAEQKKPRPRAKSAAGKKSRSGEDRNAEKPPVHGSADEDQASELDKNVQDIASHLESAVKEIEEAAKERPMLALLAAFTIGIVVGHLLSRR